MLPLRLLLLLPLFLSLPAVADSVWLTNGDRLTGQVRLYDGGTLLLETDYGGLVRISGKSVATLETRSVMLVRPHRLQGSRVYAQLRPATPGHVYLIYNGETRLVRLTDIRQILPRRQFLEEWIWRGSIDFSVDIQRGDTDIDDHDIAITTDFRHGDWRHNLRGEYNREYKDDVRSVDNWHTQYALDYFIDEKWFWQGRLQYRRDDIEEIARRRSIGSGPGYQFWDNELGALSLTSLLNRDDFDYADGGAARTYTVAMKWDYNRFLVGKAIEVFSSGEVGLPLSSSVSEKLDAQIGLRYRLTSWASFSTRIEWDRVTGDDGRISLRRYIMSLGVNW